MTELFTIDLFKLMGGISYINDPYILLDVPYNRDVFWPRKFELMVLNDLKNLFSFDLELTLDHMNPEKIAEFEARSSVGQLARGEQVYYAQMNEFTDNLEQFAAGFKTETEFYQFKIKLINPEILQILAIPKIEGLNSYLGGVFAVPTAGFKSKYIICETENSQLDSSVIPTLNNDELSCPDGFNVVDY